MSAGHLFMPARATATTIARLAFVGCVAGTGALAGWRERRGRELVGDEELGPEPLWMVAGVVTALAAAWVAFYVVHR